jgi:polysaccharide chain length determinant protein (PEP-CTERM system associated)
VNEFLSLIYGYMRAAWRRRNIALRTAAVAAVLIWTAVMLLPDKYEASARVFVDARTSLRTALEGIALEEDYESQLALVRDSLLARPQLEAVARKTGLDANVDSPAAMEHLITGLQKEIVVASFATANVDGKPSSDTIYNISYQNEDRQKAEEVVQTLLENFKEDTRSGNRSGTSETQTVLDQQIAEQDKRLKEQEHKLKEFKRENVGLIPGERGDYYTQLDAESTALQTARNTLQNALSRREELRKQLGEASKVVRGAPAGTPNSVGAIAPVPDVTVRIMEKEKQLEDMLLRFTPEYRGVKALEEQIKQLKEQEAKDLADMQNGGTGSGAVMTRQNPVYLNIQQQLNGVDVEVAAARDAVRLHETEHRKLRTHANLRPEIEEQYVQLNRDYKAIKETYDRLTERREQALVSESTASTGIVDFDVIEPPHAGFQPVSPKRPLLVFAGLFGAIGLGLGLALLPYFFKPTFDDADSIERKLGIPVLGTISAVRGVGRFGDGQASGRMVVFAGLALFAVAGVLAVFANESSSYLRGLIS